MLSGCVSLLFTSLFSLFDCRLGCRVADGEVCGCSSLSPQWPAALRHSASTASLRLLSNAQCPWWPSQQTPPLLFSRYPSIRTGVCAIRRAESPGELTGKGRRNLGEQVLLQSANVPSEEPGFRSEAVEIWRRGQSLTGERLCDTVDCACRKLSYIMRFLSSELQIDDMIGRETLRLLVVTSKQGFGLKRSLAADTNMFHLSLVCLN